MSSCMFVLATESPFQENVLVNEDRHALLTGFASSASSVPTGLTEEIAPGPLRWLCPEVLLDGKGDDFAADVWAWGCLAIEVS